MGRKKYSKELRARIALDAIKGQKTIAELASEYGVHANQISIWKKQLLDATPAAFSNGKYEGLSEPQRYSCNPQTYQALDTFNWLGVNSSQKRP